MTYVAIVTVLAILQLIVFSFKVGGARSKYGVKAPATSGNEIFERHFRVHQNTLEQLVALLPGLYIFSRYVNPLGAAGLGVVYLVGRELYAATYVKDPARRGPGFALTFLPIVILLLGGLAGAVLSLVRG